MGKNTDPSAQKDTTEFALPTKIRFAKQRTKQNAKPSTRTIVMRLTETFKSPMLKNVCNDKDVAVCDKHWRCQNPNLPLENCNDKVWVDNQASCKYLKQTVCNQVEKYRTTKEPYQQCDQQSWQDCKDVPYEVCDLVTRENCKDEPYNDCRDVPYQDCREIHKQVPHQVSRKRPFRVCDGVVDHYKYSDQEIADYDFIELRTGASEESDVESVEQSLEDFTTKAPTKKAPGAITFG